MTCLVCTRRDPAPAYYACTQCIDRTRGHLRELELYAAWLPMFTGPTGGTGTGRRTPGYGSRPPADLGVLVMLDHRSNGLVLGEDDDDSPLWSLLGTVHGCAQFVRRHATGYNPIPTRNVTLVREIGYLLGRLDWCAHQPWIADLADDLARLHAQARALTRDAPPEPLGQCLNDDCEGTVFWQLNPDDTGAQRARCSACDRTYSALQVVTLATTPRVAMDLVLLALRDSGITVTDATVRSWVRRGHITRTAAGYDLAEITAHVDRTIPPRDRCTTTGRIQSSAPA